MGERRNNSTFNLRSITRNLSLKRKGTKENPSSQPQSSRSPPPNQQLSRSLPQRDVSTLGYSSLNSSENLSKRTSTVGHRKGQQSYDVLGSRTAKKQSSSRLSQLPLRASRSDESLVSDVRSPPKLQSTARGAPLGPPPYGSPLPAASPYIITSPKLSNAQLSGSTPKQDVIQNVKDHMRAKEELLGSGPFYSVQRGWKKGIYVSKDEADRQIRNFPGPIMKIYENLDEAIAFLEPDSSHSRALDEDADEEVLGRARIFAGLTVSESGGLRKAFSLSAERKELRRKSKEANGTIPIVASTGRLPSFKQMQKHGYTLEDIPLSSEAETAPSPTSAVSATPIAGPKRVITLLPVKSLANSVSFYSKVLGFSYASHLDGAQAVMVSDTAVLCLRALEFAPSAPSHGGLGRSGSMSRGSNGGRNPARKPLPAMTGNRNETPALESPTRRERRASRSPVPPPPPPRTATMVMSGISVLLEHGDSIESLHVDLADKIQAWVQTSRTSDESIRIEGAKLLSGIEDRTWGAQEVHVSDPDGHRLIFSTPLKIVA